MAMVTQSSENLMTVLPASKILNVSVDTIRRWEKKGLIRAVRGELGERLFDTKELSRIASRGGKSSGAYRILKAAPSNITSVELFSGAGGLALGMQNAGIQHKMLVDLDKDSTLTLKQNRPDWDVRNESR
jgi:DNA (cytosine-5)-methyltransferase 1